MSNNFTSLKLYPLLPFYNIKNYLEQRLPNCVHETNRLTACFYKVSLKHKQYVHLCICVLFHYNGAASSCAETLKSTKSDVFLSVLYRKACPPLLCT